MARQQPPPRPLLGKEGVHWPNMVAPRGSATWDKRWGHYMSGPLSAGVALGVGVAVAVGVGVTLTARDGARSTY